MITLNNVQKNYGDFTLDCSLNVKPGRVTGIIGANGAGKSTLFKAILNLISIDSGKVTIFDKDSRELTREDKEKIGVVLSSNGFSEYLNVKSVVKIMDATYSKFDREVFLQRCEKFKLPLNKKIKEFSTGMKAKLNALIAMSFDAKILVLDEPTSGLDVIARTDLLDMIREYMEEEEDGAVLISSHISGDLEGLCDEIYMIHDGKIIFHEDTDELLDTYGILKITQEQFKNIEKDKILYTMEEKYGYKCLTKDKQYFTDNFSDIVVEKGSIDEALIIIEKGEQS